jgi:predicted metal-dependent peptidase
MPIEPPTPEQLAAANAARALRLVAATLPHLSGLAHSVRVKVTKKYPVAAIGASGLMLVNPAVFSQAPLPDLVFVAAHELMHLALDTFGRAGGADPFLVNVAHDYVINDILAVELHRDVPFGGCERHGARRESLEALVSQLARAAGRDVASQCWSIAPHKRRYPKSARRPKTAIQQELEKAGLLPPEPEEPDTELDQAGPDGDTLSAEEEAEHEPELGPQERTAWGARVRREAVRAVSLKELRQQIDKATGQGGGGGDAGATRTLMEAVATAYQPPWQLALQHWLDAVSPGPRSYARPSRRGAERDDGVILAGRRREGWTLHVVLDTSGSMIDTLPHILGLLGSFCDGAGVTQVHVMQCDVGVTADEWIDPSELTGYKITGFGGSDMSPALDALADDPEVSAVLVLTDGLISYPDAEPAYSVLWGLVDGSTDFDPRYGTVVRVKT